MALGLVVYDLIYLMLATLLYGTSALAGMRVARGLPWFFGWPLGVIAFLVVLIAEVGVLTACLPRLKAGRYLIMKEPIYYSWIFRSMLRRILFVPGLLTWQWDEGRRLFLRRRRSA